MILLMFGLQRLAYGRLRVIEIEQLYEKAWFAITETCLAMTVFREEVGGWFLVMFVSLLAGKVWSWLSEGRVEILEQQPPSNPRLFHIRLSTSLLMSVAFDLYMFIFSVQSVRDEAEPNMMVMFAFEFAVLSVMSISTSARYMISIYESALIRSQIVERRLIARTQREDQQHSQANTEAATDESDPASNLTPDDADADIDVPGWETKGFWIFYLDLATDFLKLLLYLSFFCVLCVFYGMPLHIIRDVAMTIRSFYRRVNDFIRYRQATQDMNDRYPDATPEEVRREDVCIICRETMTSPQILDGQEVDHLQRRQDQRLRAKRLPCGHILHFACLRSWLERQQNCPTCRRPVLLSTPLIRPHNDQPAPPTRRPTVARDVHDAGERDPDNPRQDGRQNNIRVLNLGPFRVGFGTGQDIHRMARQMDPPHLVPNLEQTGTAPATTVSIGSSSAPHPVPNQMTSQLQVIERQIMQQLSVLHLAADQLYLVRAMQGELTRLRLRSTEPSANPAIPHFHPTTIRPTPIPDVFAQPSFVLPQGWTAIPLNRIPIDVINAGQSIVNRGDQIVPSQPNEEIDRSTFVQGGFREFALPPEQSTSQEEA
ncbi:E3 ubiquitin-protein ligase hrd1 [Agyrium rufum]|nr:E3 ubiquitin-protein ligase hrd1 [Agyrium rufum]